MEPIVIQQLRLEYGEKFKEMRSRTESYVKGLISKPWWEDTFAMVESEGGLGNMVMDCMVRIYEKQDKLEGYKAYTSYLTSWYGRSLSGVRNQMLDDVRNVNRTVWNTLGEWSNDDRPNGDGTSVEKLVVQPEWLNEEQAEFLLAFSRLGAQELAALEGESYNRVMNKYRAAKTKVRRNT